MRILASVTLQGPQVISVTKPGSQTLENRPVTPRPFGADLALEVCGEVSDDAVVVEQRIVHIEQENDSGSSRSVWDFPLHLANGRTVPLLAGCESLTKGDTRLGMRSHCPPSKKRVEVS